MFFTKPPVPDKENIDLEKYYCIKKNQRVVYVVIKLRYNGIVELETGMDKDEVHEVEKLFFNHSLSSYSIVKKQRNSKYFSKNMKKKEKKELYTYRGVIDDILETKLLPMISGDDDFKKRVGRYEDEKESRKTEFLRKTIDGYAISKKMWYNAYRQIQFWESGEEVVLGKVSDALKNKDLQYPAFKHMFYMKRIVICLRRVAECCYFLDRFDEGIEFCQKIINIVNTHKINRKMLKLVYGLMGKIMISKGDLKKAREFIEMGFILDPMSGIIARAKDNLEKAEKGEYYETDRIKIRKTIASIEVYEKFFDDLLSERISFLNQSKEWCTNDLDEIKSHFQIQLMNKIICFCRIYFFL